MIFHMNSAMSHVFGKNCFNLLLVDNFLLDDGKINEHVYSPTRQTQTDYIQWNKTRIVNSNYAQ